MRYRSILIPIATTVALLAAVGTTGAADTYGSFDETYGDDYQSGDLARLTSAVNGVTIVRGHADDGVPADEGIANSPVFAGDLLKTAVDQRVELQLADGSLVRLDQASELRVQAFPDPYAEFKDNTVLALPDGTVQIVAGVREGETFRIDTSGATVYLTGSGDFRIEARRDGRTRVYSRQGVAEVAGDGGSVLVRAGQMTEAWAGAYPGEPQPFNTLRADAFDRWTQDLDRAWQVRQQPDDPSYPADAAYSDVPDEVRPYYRELSNHGRWVYVEDYGWSWYPVGVAVGWRPYVEGGWVYGPNGYFWVASEPWGWAPYHYGRWSHVPTYGWIWSPGRVFAGAWVSWSWGSTYIGWCPINYWNRPVFYGSPHWGYYGSNCWTFVHYSHISVRNSHRYAVPVHRIGGDLDGRAISSRPPRVDPRSIRTDADARREAVRQTREGRPALDRGLQRRGGDGVAGDRTRFRDAEERFVKRGGRADRVASLRENGRRSVAADERGTRASNGARARGATDRTADGRVRGRSEARAGAGGRDVARATSRQTADGIGGDVRTRPRQIRPESGARDERVRDMYRRIQRNDGSARPSNGSRARSSEARSNAERAGQTTRDRRATGPTRTSPGGNRSSTTAVRPQRRSGTSERATPPARSAPSRGSRGSGNAVRPAPKRESTASPGRSRAPSRSATPKRSSGGSRSVTPSRSRAPSRSASPGKSSGGSRSASPSRSRAPSRSATPKRSSGGSRSASPSKSSGSKGSRSGRSGRAGKKKNSP